MEVGFEVVLVVVIFGGAFLVGVKQMSERQVRRGLKERCSCRTYGTIGYLDSGFYVEEPRLRRRYERMGSGGMGLSVGGYKLKGLLRSMPQFGLNGRWTYGPNIIPHRFTIYNYHVEGKEYSGIDARIPYVVFSAGQPGDEVEICYNPKNPSEFYCPREDRNVRWSPWVGLGIVAAPFLMWEMWRMLGRG